MDVTKAFVKCVLAPFSPILGTFTQSGLAIFPTTWCVRQFSASEGGSFFCGNPNGNPVPRMI